MLYGIDVSNWQGSEFPWDHFRGKIQFALAKATEGTDFTDPDFAHNIAMMKEIGVIRGAYHFFHPAKDTAKQLMKFADVCDHAGIGKDDLIALDHETSDGLSPVVVAKLAFSAASYMATRWQCSPLIYTYQNFALEGNCANLGQFPLWRADPYGADMPVPKPWSIVSVDQYSTVPEDQNRAYFGTPAQLEHLAVGSGTIPIAIPPVPISPQPWDEDHLWHIWHLVNQGLADAHIIHLQHLWISYFKEVNSYPCRSVHLNHVLTYARDTLHVTL
jgi:lysozyme